MSGRLWWSQGKRSSCARSTISRLLIACSSRSDRAALSTNSRGRDLAVFADRVLLGFAADWSIFQSWFASYSSHPAGCAMILGLLGVAAELTAKALIDAHGHEFGLAISATVD